MIDLTRTRVENCPISSEWIEIKNSFTEFSSAPLIKRDVQLNIDASTLIPATIGYLTTIAARFGETEIDKVISRIKRDGHVYLKNKGNTYKNMIDEKIKLLCDRKRGD